MKAIVYTSNTGFTARYAQILGEKTGLPVWELSDARKRLPKGTPIIYMGWLFAGSVKGYAQAFRRFSIRAVCGVGLCDTGALLREVRKAISLPEEIPLFTLQGGMDHSKLKGINKFMIGMLLKMLQKNENPTDDDRRMLQLVQNGGDYVSEEDTEAFLQWYRKESNMRITQVVAALIWENGKFMICQRPAHKARGLLWEFVGGKVEPGESQQEALIRECREELAVEVSVGDVFMEVLHEYPDLTVHLTLFHATIAAGTPQKLEHEDIRWISPPEIPQYDFCPADVEILERIVKQYGETAHA